MLVLNKIVILTYFVILTVIFLLEGIKINVVFLQLDLLRWGNQHDNSVYCLLLTPHGDDMGILPGKSKRELNGQRVGCLDDFLDLVACGVEGAQEDEGVDADLTELGASLCCLHSQRLRIQNEARGAKCWELDGGGGSGFRDQ